MLPTSYLIGTSSSAEASSAAPTTAIRSRRRVLPDQRSSVVGAEKTHPRGTRPRPPIGEIERRKGTVASAERVREESSTGNIIVVYPWSLQALPAFTWGRTLRTMRSSSRARLIRAANASACLVRRTAVSPRISRASMYQPTASMQAPRLSLSISARELGHRLDGRFRRDDPPPPRGMPSSSTVVRRLR